MVSLTLCIHLCGRVCQGEQRGAAGTQSTLPSSAAFGELEQRKSRLLSNNLISFFSSNNNNNNKCQNPANFFIFIFIFSSGSDVCAQYMYTMLIAKRLHPLKQEKYIYIEIRKIQKLLRCMYVHTSYVCMVVTLDDKWSKFISEKNCIQNKTLVMLY